MYWWKQTIMEIWRHNDSFRKWIKINSLKKVVLEEYWYWRVNINCLIPKYHQYHKYYKKNIKQWFSPSHKLSRYPSIHQKCKQHHHDPLNSVLLCPYLLQGCYHSHHYQRSQRTQFRLSRRDLLVVDLYNSMRQMLSHSCCHEGKYSSSGFQQPRWI